MNNNVEKIKDFFGDEEKVKEIISDEDFINKVLTRKATLNDYREEFSKLGLKLEEKEAEQTKDVVEKILKRSGEKLDDKFLVDISGGSSREVANTFSLITTQAALLSFLGCGIASCVYLSKANKSKVSGNSPDYSKYITKAKNCGIAATSLIGTAGVAGIVAHITASKAQESNDSLIDSDSDLTYSSENLY